MPCCILRARGACFAAIGALQQQQGQAIDGSTGAFIPGLQSLSVSTPMTVRWHRHSDHAFHQLCQPLAHEYLSLRLCSLWK